MIVLKFIEIIDSREVACLVRIDVFSKPIQQKLPLNLNVFHIAERTGQARPEHPKPLEGLKVVLFPLFTEEEVKVSSLKGINTGSGQEGFNKQKLGLVYRKLKKQQI